jgi:LITAF-like zinc ribbon domain
VGGSSDSRVWSAICCLTCGIIAAIIPLVVTGCKDVEHSCPRCGFVMARYQRGLGLAKVFPVVPVEGYIPVGQDPPVGYTQQSGTIPAVKT